ncbi:MAG: HD-GYP domain-containing protein, partial [Negativicutes bacterium]|nr:HD-GYP domain-containing protein [Negativicutes bacterium]
MRRILLDNISVGMKLAKPLYSADGQILLSEGIELTERYVKRLKELDVTYIYIEDEFTKDIDVPDVVSERARMEAVTTAKSLMDHVKLGKNIDAGRAKKTTNMLIDELCRNHGTLMNFVDMRTRADYLYGHAVNVCILSVMTGISLGYDELRLRDLGIGALLHDVGKLEVSQAVLNKNGRLSPAEVEEIKKHPWFGFEILRKNPDISLMSAHCALQHHERFDGSGYPRGLKGKDIAEYAHIIAIADVYDALTADNTNRPAVPVYEALAIILKASGTYFDAELVAKFAENIAVYPIGSVVRLNTNEIGVV